MPDMPAWLVGALVACVLLGAVATALPSPRMRHAMRLRAHAARSGLQVRLLGAGGEPLPAALAAVEADVAYHLPHPVGATGAVWAATRTATGWTWLRPAPAPALADATRLLERLPGDARACAGDARAIRVYWNEAGPLSAVDALAETLRALRALDGMAS